MVDVKNSVKQQFQDTFAFLQVTKTNIYISTIMFKIAPSRLYTSSCSYFHRSSRFFKNSPLVWCHTPQLCYSLGLLKSGLVQYNLSFKMPPQIIQYKRFRSGDLGGHNCGPPQSIQQFSRTNVLNHICRCERIGNLRVIQAIILKNLKHNLQIFI